MSSPHYKVSVVVTWCSTHFSITSVQWKSSGLQMAVLAL